MRNEGIVELYAPRRTLIGRDGITKIPHFLQRLSSKCVLVVTDKGLIKVAPPERSRLFSIMRTSSMWSMTRGAEPYDPDRL